MTDVLKNAMNYRDRLQTELAQVEGFLRMAKRFADDSDDNLRLSTANQAGSAPNGSGEETKPRTPFERMQAEAKR